MAHTKKSLRVLRDVLEPLGYRHVGKTRNGHFTFQHGETGRILVTVSDISHHRSVDNTVRSAKNLLRRTGAKDV